MRTVILLAGLAMALLACGGDAATGRGDIPIAFKDVYTPPPDPGTQTDVDPGDRDAPPAADTAPDGAPADATPDPQAPDPIDESAEDLAVPDDAAPTDPASTDVAPTDPAPADLVATDPAPSDPGMDDADVKDAGCTATSCPAGQTCSNGDCMDCLFQFACGPECVDCRNTAKPLCLDGACVECRIDSDCFGLGFCKDNACVPCGSSDPLHCGAECATCAGETPDCVDGTCSCTATSCLTDFCVAGQCRTCSTDDACGPSCVGCLAPTPHCHGSTCTACIVAADCSTGEWCSAGGVCTPCVDDDPLHCGSVCGVCTGTRPSCTLGACRCSGDSCGNGSQCIGGACVGCTTAIACGSSCGACNAPTPYCHADGHCAQCQAATVATDCPAGWQCTAAGNCLDPCAGTQGCATDTKSTNGTKCSTAWTLGRSALAKGLNINGDTTDRGDDDDLPSSLFNAPPDCWDANWDEAYKVYLFAGDVLKVNGIPLSSTYTLSLKLYRGTSCASNWKADLIACKWKAGDGGTESYAYTATQDGWVSIVVDGASAFDTEEDWGPYTLNATLTCSGNKCCCQ